MAGCEGDIVLICNLINVDRLEVEVLGGKVYVWVMGREFEFFVYYGVLFGRYVVHNSGCIGDKREFCLSDPLLVDKVHEFVSDFVF